MKVFLRKTTHYYALPIIFFLTLFLEVQAREEASYDDDQYFVVLRHSPVSSSDSDFLVRKEQLVQVTQRVVEDGGTILQQYLYAFLGFHARLSEDQVARLHSDPSIKFIAPNGKAHLFNEFESLPNWGIDRIDQSDLPLDGTYETESLKGAQVHVYVVDTGIRPTHKEFKYPLGKGYSALKDDPSTIDCNGHGTHVAGTVSGLTVGVAVESILHPVRVFGCSGGTGWDVIIKAIDWVIANHRKPAVINMSLGGGANQAVDTAVANAVKAGITVVVAAGNSNADACSTSPAREPSAITVAASTKVDSRAGFSNYGRCVDIIAPGVQIRSADHRGDALYRDLSGTSMASPHVAGGAALVLSLYPNWKPSEVASTLGRVSTKEKISDVKGTKNELLYVKNFGGAPMVRAGDDVIRKIPNNDVTLKGVAKDVDGHIVSAAWSQVSGKRVAMSSENFDWSQHLILRDLPIGEYRFRFTATDNDGLSASDDIRVTINGVNRKPIANAGKDQIIIVGKNAIVSGANSRDPDGSIVGFRWEQISGPTEAVIVDPEAPKTEIRSLVSGVYQFRLTVEDDDGDRSSDMIKIRVNHAPTADAGKDRVVRLPTNNVILRGQGKDEDGDALRYLWKQISGPSKSLIESPNDRETKVSSLVEGVYVFKFYVFDRFNSVGTDSVKVAVNAVQKSPKVDAGPDQLVVLPRKSVVLTGLCKGQKDSYCVSTGWQVKQSKQVVNFSGPHLLEHKNQLHLSNLRAGVFQFVFSGTDNMGRTASDEVTLTVRENEDVM